MDCRGLVDPKNKPFGRVLPLEVPVKIMGGVFLHHGREEEGGARVQGVTEMQFDRLPASARRRTLVEPSGSAVERAPKKWLPPLPSYDGPPDVGE